MALVILRGQAVVLVREVAFDVFGCAFSTSASHGSRLDRNACSPTSLHMIVEPIDGEWSMRKSRFSDAVSALPNTVGIAYNIGQRRTDQ